MQPEQKGSKPDITLTAPLPRMVTLDLSDITPGSFTLKDALDLERVCGFRWSDIDTGMTFQKVEVLYGIAWVFLRRIEPDVTYEEVCTYNLNVVGNAVSREKVEAEQRRADIVMGVVQRSGLPPEEAEQLTLAEISALG